MQRIAIALLISLLAACSSEPAPRAAEFISPPAAQIDFGTIRVHYNAVPTHALNAQTAKEYQIERRPDSALVVIAPRQLDGDDEIAIDSKVQVQARDLAGQNQQSLTLRPVKTGDLIDYIGLVRIQPRDTMRFEVSLEVNGQQRKFDFLRNF